MQNAHKAEAEKRVAPSAIEAFFVVAKTERLRPKRERTWDERRRGGAFALLAALFRSQRFAHATFADSSAQVSTEDEARRRESELIRRAQNGDLNAFDALVALHQDKVFNLCQWNLRDADDAADAAQDVFVRAWRAIARFRGDCAFGTWLHRIAINVISDAASKRARAPQRQADLPLSSTRSDDETPEIETPDLTIEANPQDAALRHEKRRAVQLALAALPAPQRAVLVMFDVQGHSYEDVAAILELPLGTVKSRLSRARLALRAQLESCRELWDG